MIAPQVQATHDSIAIAGYAFYFDHVPFSYLRCCFKARTSRVMKDTELEKL